MTQNMNPTELRMLAHALTDRGMRVFPVCNKRPVRGTAGYHGDEPFTHEQIDAMPWQSATHVGVALPRGTLAIDIDVRDGKQGRKQLDLLEAAHGLLPSTLTQTTPSGGEHRIFRLPAGAAESRLRSHPAIEGIPAAETHLDLIHAKHRFVTVYEPAKFLDGLSGTVDLPLPWLPAITRLAPQRHAMAEVNVNFHGINKFLDGRIEAMAQVPVGHRNETVFGIAADLARFGVDDEHAVQRLRKAALDSGLGPTEVDRAIEQGSAAGVMQRSPYDQWFARHAQVICHVAPRTRYLLEAALMHIARTLIVARRVPNEAGDITGLFSGRSIAQALGIGTGTAHRLLRLMAELGVIQRVSPGGVEGRVATEYRLVGIDADANWSTQPPSSIEYENEICMLHFHPSVQYFDLLTLPALLDHNLFRNSRDGGLSLSKGTAFTLCTIMAMQDDIMRIDLADFTGFSEATSARHLATLIDFGLIHVNAFGDFKLAVPDVFAALDELEATCIVPDRRARQAAAFEAARAAIDARQVDRQA